MMFQLRGVNILLLLFGMTPFCVSVAQADTVLRVTIGPSAGGPSVFQDQWLGTSFTLTSTWTNVSITPTGLIQTTGTGFPDEGFSGKAWLTTAYGPGATTGNVIAVASVSNLGSGTLLEGLTLGPGTYYFMISTDEPIGGSWASSSAGASTIVAGPGVTYQGVGTAPAVFGLDRDFPPASTAWFFGGPPRDDNAVWGLTITGAPVPAPPECRYFFSAGAGASLIRYCITETGAIAKLEAPAGQEHIGVGEAWEGIVVCSGTTLQAWDLAATSGGLGSATLIAGPTPTAVAIRRSGTEFQLDQAFKLDKKGKSVAITVTLANISGTMIPDVRIARGYDPDINNDSGDDVEVRSARSVWAGDIDAVSLTGTTWAVPTDTAVDTASSPACSPTSGAVPAVSGDASLAYVTYRVGNMAPGAKKRVVFIYRIH